MSTHSEWYRQQALDLYESYKKLRKDIVASKDDQAKTKILTEWIEFYIPECDILTLKIH